MNHKHAWTSRCATVPTFIFDRLSIGPIDEYAQAIATRVPWVCGISGCADALKLLSMTTDAGDNQTHPMLEFTDPSDQKGWTRAKASLAGASSLASA